ncbi:5047_t:CDS:1, partial [Gigaspora margarita]
ATNQRPKAKDLPCVFATFFEKYKDVGLLGCETKESQTIWHASSEKSKNRLQLYHTFFSKLVQIQIHLEEYSLCEIHYNQLIASDFLRQLLLNSSLPSASNQRGKRKISNEFTEEQAHTEHAVTNEIDVYNSLQTNKQTNEVAVQVSNKTHEIGVQISDSMLHTLETRINLLELQLNLKINEVEDLKKQLEYAYDYVIESWDH